MTKHCQPFFVKWKGFSTTGLWPPLVTTQMILSRWRQANSCFCDPIPASCWMSSKVTTSTASAGTKHNAWQIHFGRDGWKIIYLHSKQGRNRASLVETSLSVTWFLLSTRRRLEVAGQWAWLKRRSQTAMVMCVAWKWKRPHLYTDVIWGSCASLKESRTHEFW